MPAALATPIALALATAAATWGARAWYQFTAYWAGRHPAEFAQRSGLADLLVMALLGLVAVGAAAMLAARLVRRPRDGGVRRPVTAGLLLLVVVMMVGCVATAKPWAHDFLDSFRVWIAEHADVEQLRTWSERLEVTAQEIPAAKWPPAVIRLAPA